MFGLLVVHRRQLYYFVILDHPQSLFVRMKLHFNFLVDRIFEIPRFENVANLALNAYSGLQNDLVVEFLPQNITF